MKISGATTSLLIVFGVLQMSCSSSSLSIKQLWRNRRIDRRFFPTVFIKQLFTRRFPPLWLTRIKQRNAVSLNEHVDPGQVWLTGTDPARRTSTPFINNDAYINPYVLASDSSRKSGLMNLKEESDPYNWGQGVKVYMEADIRPSILNYVEDPAIKGPEANYETTYSQTDWLRKLPCQNFEDPYECYNSNQFYHPVGLDIGESNVPFQNNVVGYYDNSPFSSASEKRRTFDISIDLRKNKKVLQLEGSPIANSRGHGRWKRSFEAIARRLIRRAASPATLSKYNLKFINLSEELKGKGKQKSYPAASTSKPTTRPAAKEGGHDKKKKKAGLVSKDVHGIWGPGINVEVEKDAPVSLLSFVLKKMKKARTKSGKDSKKIVKSLPPPPLSVPPVPPVAIPKEPEVDSYLVALKESRIPCQSLEDPTDCDDFTLLFKPSWYPQSYELNDPTGTHALSSTFYNEYSSSLANFIDPSQLKLVQPAADSNDFLLQKPILFLSPNIKFTIYHHSPPTLGSLNDEIALPSIDIAVETELSSVDSSSAEVLAEDELPSVRSSGEDESPTLRSSGESPTLRSSGVGDSPALDPMVDTTGLNIVGPLSAMNVAPVST
ncbi:hypothetical protein GHT06_007775 [Daphnia sinensis]|uniref:Uncharacterized protein n=1 Tax=Daphnia sinensis TaxID=1820382 RepID=A0AAD5L2X3_9CRUS|nr:hypothetical protein GHT06_007775 [Daphnia sinensis]